ncbi:MAG: chemotaxis-specific protein-glutamate methyltransferase CheB [Bacteroidetes bacterium]|nr:chemotaxis-specific protein-glutamate methyltransferase CheB [Bacteroidota bacterium]
MKKVLVVEDSYTVRELLVNILESDPEITVIGSVENGADALRFIGRQKPDVITMDAVMPIMDGYEATRIIMETDPIPIVILSAHIDSQEISSSFEALEAGAVAVMEKPVGIRHPDFHKVSLDIIRTVKSMSEIKLIRRWSSQNRKFSQRDQNTTANKEVSFTVPKGIKIIAIGGSTGAPKIFKKILSGLPADYPIPLVAVQHISPGFIEGFAGWLGSTVKVAVSIAAKGTSLSPGHVYFAPDDLQMGVDKQGAITMIEAPREHGMIPAVSYLFRSVNENYGNKAVGILLTGMGKDGAAEMRELKQSGAITIAQNRESSTVYGMPGKAVQFDGIVHVFSPDEIVTFLKALGN